MKSAEVAFRWIVGILKNHKIPFQIAGGLAARMYGSRRELYDIDLDVPEESIEKILPEIHPYIIHGPTQYKDDHWDLLLLTLSYEEQRIDISGANNAKKFDENSQTWISARAELGASQIMEIYGMQVPVIPKARLIAYKKILSRGVDIDDL